jgi:hypothetical protein
MGGRINQTDRQDTNSVRLEAIVKWQQDPDWLEVHPDVQI